MKSSYKLALIVAALLCAFIVAYYATQDGGEGQSVASQESAAVDDGAASADARRGSDDRSAPIERPRRSALNVPDRQERPSLPSRTAADPDAGTPNATNDLMARMAQLRNRVNSANPDSATTANASPAATLTTANRPTPSTPGATGTTSTSSLAAAASPTALSDDGDSTPTSAFGSPAPSRLPGTTPGTLATTTTRTTPSPLGSTPDPTRVATPGNAPGSTSGSALGGTRNTAPEADRSPARRTSSVPAPTTPPAARPAAPATYTVQPGDTLSSIARKLYGEERQWVDISRANPTLDPAKLRVGQVIRLPGSQTVRPPGSTPGNTPGSTTSSTGTRTTAPAGTVQYTLQAGDTLSSIARQYYGDPTQWRVIFNANRARLGGNPDRLKVGTVLVIPPAPRGAE